MENTLITRVESQTGGLLVSITTFECPHCRRVNPSQLPEVRKEPWQVTREEFKNSVSGYAKARPGRSEYGFYDKASKRVLADSWTMKSLSKPEASAKVRGLRDEYHRGLVSQALSEGKPVPAEVLKDYPDLQARERKTNELESKEGRL